LIKTLGVLMAAAILEVGGDALVRRGLEQRAWMFAVGAASLVIYGVVVNRGSLDFGRLMIIIFRQLPALRTILGGSLIVAGGLTIIG
jgi:drug/metabolite transporter superfamily protein YnfA